MPDKNKIVKVNEQILLNELTYLGLYRSLSNILPYTSERKPAQYKKMRMYPMCWLGLNFIKLGLASVPPVFKSEDEEAKEITQAVFEKFWQRHVTEALECLDFGWKPAEILWKTGSVPYTIGDSKKKKIFEGTLPKCPKGLDPETIHILTFPDTGRIAGFEQYGVSQKILKEENKALVYTHMLESGHYYGISALEPAYPYWYDGNLNRQFHMRWLERKGVGILKGIYPPGKSEVGGSEVDNQDIILDLLSSVIEGRVVSIPSKRDDNGNLIWDMEFLSDEDRTDPFIERAKYIDESILRALIIPEKALTQGEIGARASVEAYQDLFLERKESLLDSIVQAIDEYLVQPFVNYNFGNNVEVHAYAGEFSDRSKDLAGKLVEKLVEGGRLKVQTHWLMDKTGIPLEEKEQSDPAKQFKNLDENGNIVDPTKDAQGNPKDLTNINEKDNPDEKQKKEEDLKKMSEGSRWRVLNKLEYRYNMSEMSDFLDKRSEQFKAELSKEILSQRDRIMKYVNKNYTSDAKFVSVVNKVEIRKAPVRRIFKDFLESIYNFVFDKISTGVASRRYMASTDTPNQFIGFRINLTGDKFAADYESTLKYQLSSDLGSKLSSTEITDKVRRVTDDYLSSFKLANTAETEVGFTLNKSFEDYLTYNKKAVDSGLLDAQQEIERVKYSAIMDIKVCPLCRELDGTVVPVDSSIKSKYDPPVHYMCRCAWLPVTLGDVENQEIPGTDYTLGSDGRPLTLDEMISNVGDKSKYKKFSEHDHNHDNHVTIINNQSDITNSYMKVLSELWKDTQNKIDKLSEQPPPQTPNITIPMDVNINMPENKRVGAKIIREEDGQLKGIVDEYEN